MNSEIALQMPWVPPSIPWQRAAPTLAWQMTFPRVFPAEADPSDPANATSYDNPGPGPMELTSHYTTSESKTDLAASLDYNQLKPSLLVSLSVTCVTGSGGGEKTTSPPQLSALLLAFWLKLNT